MKAKQIPVAKLQRGKTGNVVLGRESLHLTNAVNAPVLSGDANMGLRQEGTVASQLFRLVLAYGAVIIAWLLLN